MLGFLTDPVRCPAYYRHYKGSVYLTVHIAEHTESGQKMVVYASTSGPQRVWVRPLDMFLESVMLEGGTSVPRFEFVRWASLQDC